MLSCLMAGPIPLFGEWRCLRHQGGLQRMASAQILSFGVSSHSFDVALLKKGQTLLRAALLFVVSEYPHYI